MTSLLAFCAGVSAVVTLRCAARAICASWFASANHEPDDDTGVPNIDLGNWEGKPLDWLASVGAGALFVGIGVAIIIDLVILAANPEGPYVSDVLRAAGRQHPIIIFGAGAVTAHLFWTTLGPK